MLTAAEYRAFLEPHKVLFSPPCLCLTPYIPRLDRPIMKRITTTDFRDYRRDRFIAAQTIPPARVNN